VDTPRALYEKPASHFVADFIGDSAFLPVAVAGGVARWKDTAIALADAPGADGAYLLVLRPEKLAPVLGQPPAGANLIDAVIEDVVFQGDTLRIDVRLADGTVITLRELVRAGRSAALPGRGGPIRLALDPADAVLVRAP